MNLTWSFYLLTTCYGHQFSEDWDAKEGAQHTFENSYLLHKNKRFRQAVRRMEPTFCDDN
uniref:Uncharacterized protein n=1 Tax=Romanomermis culicivorax TaxID=13658 RepID=A0A915HSA1_ROMCU